MRDSTLVEAAQDVLENLTSWRSTRRHRDSIPEELWLLLSRWLATTASVRLPVFFGCTTAL